MTNSDMTSRPGPDRVIATYERQAEAFDRSRGKSLIEKSWLDRLLKDLPHGARILDLGCGSAEPIAAYMIERGFALTGVDAAAPMVDMCKKRFPDHHWHQADMRHLDLQTTFDAILAWNSFFHLNPDDQQHMFGVFAKHAHARTRLMFTAGPSHGEVWGQVGKEAVYHASLSPDEYRELFSRHGFKELTFVPEDPDCHGHTIWLAEKA
jgi:SAM-dependent methyltransferase